MTDFAYPIPLRTLCVQQMLQHNFPNDESTLKILRQCDSTFNILQAYLTDNASAYLGLFGGKSNEDLMQTKQLMEHHMRVAQLCNEHLEQWMQLMQIIETQDLQELSIRLPNANNALFEWNTSASLCALNNEAEEKLSQCFRDSSWYFQTIMILVCASLAHLNSAQLMRTYTALAEKYVNQLPDEETRTKLQQNVTRASDIAKDLMHVNKHALMYALMAQEQLRMFAMCPSHSPNELRPRILEALVHYAACCVQQMALPEFVQQSLQEQSSYEEHADIPATRNLCALYMGLAFNATVAFAASNLCEKTLPQTHLALNSALARSYNLIDAALLRCGILIDEAHRKSSNAEYTRAETCLLGARLLAVFAQKHAILGAKYLGTSAETCMIAHDTEDLATIKINHELRRRWQEACNSKTKQWVAMTKDRVQSTFDRLQELSVSMPPLNEPISDDQLFTKNAHRIARWLPQKCIRMKDEDMLVRLACFKKQLNINSIFCNGFNSASENNSSATQTALQHLTTLSMWTLPGFSSNNSSSSSVSSLIQTGQDPTNDVTEILYEHLPAVPTHTAQLATENPIKLSTESPVRSSALFS